MTTFTNVINTPIILNPLKRELINIKERPGDIASRRKRMAMRQIQLALRLGYDF